MSIGVGGTGAELQSNPWEQFFEMPHEAIGMGKIIQLLSKETTGNKCPGYYDMTEHCTLKWKATVTFVRTSTSTVEELGHRPRPARGPDDARAARPDRADRPAASTPPQLPPRDDLDDLLIPLPSDAKLDKQRDEGHPARPLPHRLHRHRGRHRRPRREGPRRRPRPSRWPARASPPPPAGPRR